MIDRRFRVSLSGSMVLETGLACGRGLGACGRSCGFRLREFGILGVQKALRDL